MTEAVQPLSTRAVVMVVRLDCGFQRLTLISREDVPGFPCIVTVLRSSFGAGMESEFLLAGGRGTGDLGGEATSFPPRLWENLLLWPSMSRAPFSSHPLYPGAQPPGPPARRW